MSELTERVYDAIFEDEEGRACDAIPESACHEVPGNFLLNALNGTATKPAEQLASPGLTIPWVLNAIGAPVWVSGLLVPIKNAGSLIPQMLISARIRSVSVRKWVWVGAGSTQALMLALMAASVALLSGVPGGLAVAGLLLIFSLASGAGSIAFKDVMAKTIPKGRRGQLLGTRATAGGVLTLAAGVIIYLFLDESEVVTPYVLLFALASGLWFLGSFLFSRIEERPGETGGGRNPADELKQARRLLREDKNFVRFVLARSLLLAVPLLQPFYVLRGIDLTGQRIGALGLFVLAGGLANIVASPLWGKFADRSSRSVMAAAAGLAVLGGAYALGFELFPAAAQSFFLYAPVFFINGVAYAGARLGRKTYLVDYAPSDERPLYISLSNTIIGIVTLGGALLGVLAELTSVQTLILLLMLVLAGSAGFSLSLRET